jgi:hypothetical protein
MDAEVAALGRSASARNEALDKPSIDPVLDTKSIAH